MSTALFNLLKTVETIFNKPISNPLTLDYKLVKSVFYEIMIYPHLLICFTSYFVA